MTEQDSSSGLMSDEFQAVPIVKVRRIDEAPTVAVRAWLRGGARIAPKPGLALLAGRALGEGSRHRDWRRIADDAEALGMSIETSAGFETQAVEVDALAHDWRQAVDWAAELLLEPAFPEDRCRWLSRQLVGELESLADQPEVQAGWAFLHQIYDPHPRSLPIQGTVEDLRSIDALDCAGFHAAALAGGAMVSIAGAIDADEVADYAGDRFRLPANESPDKFTESGGRSPEPEFVEPPAPVGLDDRRRRIELPPGDQAHLLVGCLTVDRRDPDLAALELAGVVLGAGAGLTGRVCERVREREGLAYSVHIRTVAGASNDPGRFAIYVGTSPETVEAAERAVVEELQRLVDDGVSAAELDDARAYRLGREPFRQETARQWARLMAEATLFGTPEDDPAWRRRCLESVDLEGVRRVVQERLDPSRLKITVGVPNA